MGRIGLESADNIASTKSELVLEICSMSTSHIACSHKNHFNNPVKSHFIDWYRLLGVAEDAGLELIKKRYHKLALQLHPDKNKHPKAEIAFKLVSEAYACLSDSVRRRAFNSERWKYFCIHCNKIPYISGNSSIAINSQFGSKPPRAQDPANFSRSGRGVQSFRDIRERLKEEVRVIENCLRVNSLSKKESPLFNPSNNLSQTQSSKIRHKSQRETPIFEPTDYVFQGYPHSRNQVYKKPENYWHLQRGKGTYQSPIFENASTTDILRGMLKSKSVCIHS
ncbi:hypothetical protein COLO4_34698 [Corchorus olitorius]|uniref:J domain-containing protein n=1 Tax=Corchorus olitorius TaxID=93759 RepID=A0A1R3GJV2_9ROSI|nr:hypothetical protein COLO4_34698 [Corchorus olitorius]